MRVHVLVMAAAALFTSAPAEAQLSAARRSTKVPGVTAPTGGTFLQGADACNTPHTNAGVGDVSGVPFTTGTTGATGQNEAGCYFFGTSGVDQDVWFDWTASASGTARVTTCSTTGVDTKIAVWPLSTCPADGTSLACNDDACGLQTTAVWSVTPGTTYTLQVGTFPGASGGPGTFAIETAAPLPCGQYDDGTSENQLGLTAGGEMGWIHYFTCFGEVDHVQTAYGSLLFPGSVTNGNGSRLALYLDTDGDGDPSTGLTLLELVNTVVVNGGTDILVGTDWTGKRAFVPDDQVVVMATADHIAGEFPGPMDQDNPVPAAWVVGSTLGPGTLDVTNLANNNIPPMNMGMVGFPTAWMLRLLHTTRKTPTCFGDGSGAPCGCGNEVPPGTEAGCRNGAGVGARLEGSGGSYTTDDTFTLICDGVINQPGLFFQGDNAIGGGAGNTFGDGIRCCGQNVVRIQVVNPPGTASPTTAQMTETATTNGPPGTIQPGDTKCYQYWYRDPAGSPCGSSFNLSNAVSVTWG